MKKKTIICALVLVGIFVAGIIAGAVFLAVNDLSISKGMFYKAEDGRAYFIEDNTAIEMSYRGMGENPIPEFNSGDSLLVVHGGIMETYPARMGLHFAVKLKDGSESDVPREMIETISSINDLVSGKDTFVATDTAFSSFTVRMNSPSEEVSDFPVVKVFYSYNEFSEFIENEKDKYGINDDFIAASESFTREYFNEKCLVLILREESSGSNSQIVSRVLKTNEKETTITVTRTMPEAGTADMAYLMSTVSLRKSEAPEGTEFAIIIE